MNLKSPSSSPPQDNPDLRLFAEDLRIQLWFLLSAKDEHPQGRRVLRFNFLSLNLAKMSKKDAEATARIRQYLEHQNRPYSVNDIFMNLHKEIGKTAVQKCLDQLVAEGSVKEKTYGKQKVYVFDQAQFPALDENQLKEMDRKITELNDAIREKEKHCGETEARLRALNSSLTTEEAEKKLQDLEEEVSRLQKKLSDLQENQVLISKEEKDKINSENEKMVKMWRKRRRMAMDILDAILEGYPKKKKDLYDDIGIETDEDVGAKLPKA